MTALHIIGLCDEREPNHYDAAAKLRWLYELDLRCWEELGGLRPLPYETGGEQLRFAEGREELYIQWLISRISAANGESERYNRAVKLFNEQYAACTAYHIRKGPPAAAASFAI